MRASIRAWACWISRVSVPGRPLGAPCRFLTTKQITPSTSASSPKSWNAARAPACAPPPPGWRWNAAPEGCPRASGRARSRRTPTSSRMYKTTTLSLTQARWAHLCGAGTHPLPPGLGAPPMTSCAPRPPSSPTRPARGPRTARRPAPTKQGHVPTRRKVPRRSPPTPSARHCAAPRAEAPSSCRSSSTLSSTETAALPRQPRTHLSLCSVSATSSGRPSVRCSRQPRRGSPRWPCRRTAPRRLSRPLRHARTRGAAASARCLTRAGRGRGMGAAKARDRRQHTPRGRSG
mmetsp:Transcript_6983/g.13456  ORF Transcript_6983/g.13456 Transcript_6983/m.13456 type:complete len:290 (-) Transcript_6983:552-1421(-)